MYWIQIIAALFLGFIIGSFCVCFWMAKRIFGTIKMVNSEDGPYLFLDMDKQPEDMMGCKYVVFRTYFKDDSQNKQ